MDIIRLVLVAAVAMTKCKNLGYFDGQTQFLKVINN
ncbi:hypothetical protein GA0071314_2563 [Halomonas sp. HL-93]|nr:MAG: hypothetical protein HLUCCO06_03330 [Halomonas sp. HL-93]SBR50200.1 hypothetical protein GA0071314_2563 [Halomonas sp. HL-93]SNY96717.1 hypothetical protein SAMN04488142_1267 [Halomonas sp. hl-4]